MHTTLSISWQHGVHKSIRAKFQHVAASSVLHEQLDLMVVLPDSATEKLRSEEPVWSY